MNDLFAGHGFSGVLPKELRRTSENAFRSSRVPIVKVRKSGAGVSVPRSTENSGKVSGPANLTTGTRHPGKKSGLREEQRILQNEIEVLEAELARAREAQEPFKQAFDSAHYDLALLHEKRAGGSGISKPLMLASYDRRVVAGHAWHPYKIKVRDLTTALKTYRQELKAVNQEIGI